MKHITSRQIALNGLIAGLYAVVTILTASFAYGNTSSGLQKRSACSSRWSRRLPSG